MMTDDPRRSTGDDERSAATAPPATTAGSVAAASPPEGQPDDPDGSSRSVASGADGSGGEPSDHGADGERPGGDGGERKSGGSFLRELPVLVVVALALALVIKAFLVQAFFIPSESMERTLLVGDRVLVNKLSYRFGEISRGDVVVFNGLDSFTPESFVPEETNPVRRGLRSVAAAFGLGQPGERDFIKRVIGVPGDVVACCDPAGRVTVNGVALDESYIYEDSPTGDNGGREFAPVTVPPGRLWVMGDHRALSADSRSHVGDDNNGTVPADKVIGRAFVIVWPVGRLDLLDRPATFEDRSLARAGVDPHPPDATVALAPLILTAVALRAVRRRRQLQREVVDDPVERWD